MSRPPQPAKTILVVDDDSELRGTVCELLQSCGHEVLAARNALEALQLSKTFPGQLDLIIIDLAMPLMDGVDLADRLRKKRPFRVLFMSGDPTVLGEDLGRRLRDAAFIQKPFTRDELVRQVRELLGAEA